MLITLLAAADHSGSNTDYLNGLITGGALGAIIIALCDYLKVRYLRMRRAASLLADLTRFERYLIYIVMRYSELLNPREQTVKADAIIKIHDDVVALYLSDRALIERLSQGLDHLSQLAPLKSTDLAELFSLLDDLRSFSLLVYNKKTISVPMKILATVVSLSKHMDALLLSSIRGIAWDISPFIWARAGRRYMFSGFNRYRLGPFKRLCITMQGKRYDYLKQWMDLKKWINLNS